MTKRPMIGIPVVVIHDERAARLDGDFRDVVARDVAARLSHGFQRGGVDDAIDGDDLRIEFLGGELQLVALARR